MQGEFAGTAAALIIDGPTPPALPPRPQGPAARGKIRPFPDAGFTGTGSSRRPDPGRLGLQQISYRHDQRHSLQSGFVYVPPTLQVIRNFRS